MLLVLRHGPSEWNAPPTRCQGQLDVPLSAEGRAAARRRAPSIELPDAAWSSHLSRARETAEILLAGASNPAGLPPPPVRADPRLAEACCGEWQGWLHEGLRRRAPDAWSAMRADTPTFRFPGGESFGEVLARFSAALAELDRRHGAERALVVTHGGPIRLFLVSRGLLTSAEPGAPPRNLEGFTLDRGRVELATWSDHA